jgi:hypothetical protein
MNKFFKSHFFEESYCINYNTSLLIFCSPIIVSSILSLLLIIPISRSFGFWLLEENNPIEILTFIFFLIGGMYGIFSSTRLFKQREDRLEALFFLIFSFFLIIIGMEEISWGQQFFGFETPTEWKAINLQGETNLHNIGFMQTHSDTLHFIFGLSGLIGVFLRNYSMFKKLGVPLILIPWFIIITIQSLADIFVDVVPVNDKIYHVVERTSEFTELLIAGVAFFYLWLNFKLLKQDYSS